VQEGLVAENTKRQTSSSSSSSSSSKNSLSSSSKSSSSRRSTSSSSNSWTNAQDDRSEISEQSLENSQNYNYLYPGEEDALSFAMPQSKKDKKELARRQREDQKDLERLERGKESPKRIRAPLSREERVARRAESSLNQSRSSSEIPKALAFYAVTMMIKLN
jgi:hypothetical protein